SPYRVLTALLLTVASGSTAHAQPAVPPPPNVTDPMLAPMPAAPRNIASFDEALSLVKTRSTDLRIAYLEIERAAAQSRVALAGLLPTITGTGTGTHNFITKDTPPGLIPLSGPSTTPTENTLVGAATIVQPIVNVRAWQQYGTARAAEVAS